MAKKKISILVPVYCEEIILDKSIQDILRLTKYLKDHIVEYIFIDDASTDGSWAILEKFAHKNKNNFITIRLAKNVGSWDALFAGLKFCTGDAAILIGADGQEPVESIVEMVKLWQGEIKAVYGIRKTRKDPILQKLFASIHYNMFRLIGIKNYPKRGFDFSLIDRVIIDAILNINQKNIPTTTLIFSLGHPYALLPYHRKERIAGRSKWTFSRRLSLSIDACIAFSRFPIRWMGWLGLGYVFFSIGYAVFVIISKWLNKQVSEDWSVSTAFQSFTDGIQILMLFILGEYLWRILDSVYSRPRYTIQKILNKKI